MQLQEQLCVLGDNVSSGHGRSRSTAYTSLRQEVREPEDDNSLRLRSKFVVDSTCFVDDN